MAGKVIPTHYGEFIERYYEPVHNSAGQSLGVNMYLEFKPGDRVIDAQKLGFVQAVKKQAGGYDISSKYDKKHKLVQTGIGEEYEIDQFDLRKNPLYATGKEKDNTVNKPRNKLEGYADNEIKKVDHSKKTRQLRKQTDNGLLVDRMYSGFGEFGYRYFKPESSMSSSSSSLYIEKNASFQDTPHFTEAVSNSSEEFETTVVVSEGKQKGLYLGSVTWGWKRTGLSETDFKPMPFELKSLGAPSEIFFQSAERWNNAKTPIGKKTVDLPMSEGKVLPDKLKFYKQEGDVGTARFTELSKGTRCRLIRQEGNYLHIRVLDTAGNFKEGLVPRVENGILTIDEIQAFPNWLQSHNEK